jgi:hypothetical protein
MSTFGGVLFDGDHLIVVDEQRVITPRGATLARQWDYRVVGTCRTMAEEDEWLASSPPGGLFEAALGLTNSAA